MPHPHNPDIRRRLRDRLLALPPRAFELFAGELLEFIDLRDVAVTRYTSDGGLDAVGSLETSAALISIPTGVQVKRHRANVQRADIDRFIGALHGRFAQGIFITTAGYAPQALLKAGGTLPRIATIGGDHVAALMLKHQLGVTGQGEATDALDEAYFGQFEALADHRPKRVVESASEYTAEVAQGGIVAHPEDDLVTIRALSHALRVDPSVLRRLVERGELRPEQLNQATARGSVLPPRSDRDDPRPAARQHAAGQPQ